jgi:glutamate-5-semialdehyde dehydrogenase
MNEAIWGFLGVGNMGGALVNGLLAGGVAPERVRWCDRNPARPGEMIALGLDQGVAEPGDLIDACDILVLGIKPSTSAAVIAEVAHRFRPGQTVVSLLAGTRLKALQSWLPEGVTAVRAMPNTPVGVGLGVIGLSLPPAVDPRVAAEVTAVLGSAGAVLAIDEAQMDALTAVAGSGPAFVFRTIAAMESAAEQLGLEPHLAEVLVRQTVVGGLGVLSQASESPAELARRVASPGGTTEAGLQALDAADLTAVFTSVYTAAQRRGRAMAGEVLPPTHADLARALVARAQPASRSAAALSGAQKSDALEAAAQALEADAALIVAANQRDLAAGAANQLSSALIDRLLLDRERLAGVIADLRRVAHLPDPAGRLLETRGLDGGLTLEKVAVPIGVVAVIYESRPNVTVDTAGLCIRSGNAVLLRGGKEAAETSDALVSAMRRGLAGAGFNPDMVQLVKVQERSFVGELLQCTEGIDLVVPRGGPGLIKAVVEQSRIPVVKHDKGVCSVYVHHAADLAMAEAIVVNAKTQRPGVCNAIENLLVDAQIAAVALPRLGAALLEKGVALLADERALPLLPGAQPAVPSDWSTEYLDLTLAVKVVDDLDDAIAFVARYGSHHSDAIVTDDAAAATTYLGAVDSAAVYHNASTRFTDGAMFGLGAEVGISTNRLHARGPMGLAELCTYKYVVRGNGQTR